MSAQLDLVAKRAATWSQSANRLKKRIDFVRWLVFALAIIGALLAAVASQTQETQEAQALHGALTAFGTVLLAAGTFISARLLKDTELAAWVRMRAAAEALKREAFKYAAGARPYDDGAHADQVLDRGREDIEKDLDDLYDRTITPNEPGSAPSKTLTADEYRDSRVIGQVEKFYRVRAKDYQTIAARLRVIEFVLALTATVITALAGVVGKLPVVAGIRFDLAALTAVLTTISGAILAHIEASRYQYLVTSYLATARRLEHAAADFDAAKADPQKWSDYVNRCEDIIAAESSSWVARWTKSKT
jgi:conflict system pore-forming effector with SLATT domain/uncharacterized protein DUF4231